MLVLAAGAAPSARLMACASAPRSRCRARWTCRKIRGLAGSPPARLGVRRVVAFMTSPRLASGVLSGTAAAGRSSRCRSFRSMKLTSLRVSASSRRRPARK
jgi:hypothetical protein